MNILHVANNAAPQFGGAYRSIGLFRAAAASKNYPTHCISFDDEPSKNPHAQDPYWSVVPTCKGAIGTHYGLISRRDADKLAELVKWADVVCVHLLYRYHVIWAAHCARKFGKPLIVIPHGGLDPYVFTYRGFRKKAWLKAYRNLVFRDSVLLYATDREMRKAALAVSGVKAKSLYWPMDDAVCRRADTSPRVPGVPRRLLFVGRLHSCKRVLETVRAFSRLREPGWQLVLVGAESEEISAEDLRRAASDQWNVSVFYGGVLDRSSLYTEYSRASGLVLMSHKENFGHAVAEAMRFGLPVIISDGVDLGGVVIAAGAGTVVPVRSEEAIVDGLKQFLRRPPEELDRFGTAAKIAATKLFDFQNFSESYNSMLESLASPRPHAAASVRPLPLSA